MKSPMKSPGWTVRQAALMIALLMSISRVLPDLHAQGGPPPGAGPGPAVFTLDSVSTTVTVNNPIFSTSPVTGSIAVTVGHTGGPGGYVLTVSRGSSSTFDPRTMLFLDSSGPSYPPLLYNIYTPDGEIARDLSVPLSNEQVIRGTFGNSGNSYNTVNHAFEVRIPEEQFVQRGNYQDHVEITLYKGRSLDPDDLDFVGSETVTIDSLTPTVAEIAISGQNDHTLDFGQLVQGLTRTAELQYRTNAGFEITAVSENNGVMKHSTESTSDPIPYQLTLGGNAVDLSAPDIVGSSQFFGTTIDFELVPIEVTIGAFDQVLAGAFQDVITFTISAF